MILLQSYFIKILAKKYKSWTPKFFTESVVSS